jgi:hypothetical protein
MGLISTLFISGCVSNSGDISSYKSLIENFLASNPNASVYASSISKEQLGSLDPCGNRIENKNYWMISIGDPSVNLHTNFIIEEDTKKVVCIFDYLKIEKTNQNINERYATGFQTIGSPTNWDLKSDGNLILNITNNKLATTLTVYEITATISGTDTKYNPTNLVLDQSESNSVTFATTSTLTTGLTYSIRLTMLYNAGGLNHTDVGTITGIVALN